MAAVSIKSVQLCGPGTNDGSLDITDEHVHWRAKGSDKTVSLPYDNIKGASFYDFGRSCQMWVADKTGGLARFDGLRLTDFDRIAAAMAPQGLTLTKRQLSAKGRNWGTLRVNGGNLELLDDENKLSATLPMASISQAALPGKGEVEIQFFDDDTVEREDEVLVEMRFFLPVDHVLPGVDMETAYTAARASAKAKRRAKAGAAAEDEVDDDEDAAPDASVVLHSLITDAADINDVSGEPIAELGEDIGTFLVPRGRYAIELYPSFMRLIGKTYDFKVAYKSVARMFYLERPSTTGEKATRFALVISLDDPVRHGAQRYPHLVMQLEIGSAGGDSEIALHLSAEDIAAGKYEGLGADGTAKLRGELPRIVAMLLKHVTGKPVFKTGGFRSALSQGSIRCSCKSNDGLLYPLDKSLIFIHKPTTYLRYAEVDHVELQRGDSALTAARTFDLSVSCKAVGGEAARTVLFNGIDKAERSVLKSFLEGRGVRVVETQAASAGRANLEELSGDEDDDFGGGGGYDDDIDGGGKKRKRSAASSSKHGGGGGDDDDDDDDDDEDFDAAAAAAKADSASDDDDDGGDSDASDDGGGKSKSKKKGKESPAKSKPSKKSKSKKADSDDEGSDGGSGGDSEDDGFRRKKKGASKKRSAPAAKKRAAPKKKPSKKRKRKGSDDEGSDEESSAKSSGSD